MKTTDSVGVFEAKTRFSEICEQVASSGEPITVTRRGEPLVTISALEEPDAEKAKKETIWEARERFEKEHGSWADEPDFEIPRLPEELRTRTKSPFDDDDRDDGDGV